MALTYKWNTDFTNLPYSVTTPPVGETLSESFAPSFLATWDCSKLRMPSSPHRSIMALSFDTSEQLQMAITSLTSSHGEPLYLHKHVAILCENHSHGVVNIWSPVNTALAPAIKHITCSDSFSVFLPAASRIIVEGRAILAVAMVLTKVWCFTGL